MLQMRRSVFCFLLPGDTPSSRRLSDIIIAGCIPVFLGAPYHAMPFADEIAYADFALFFRLDAFQRNSSMYVAYVRLVHVMVCMPPGLIPLSPNRVCAWAWLRAPQSRSPACAVSLLGVWCIVCAHRACCDASLCCKPGHEVASPHPCLLQGSGKRFGHTRAPGAGRDSHQCVQGAVVSVSRMQKGSCMRATYTGIAG